MTRLAHLVPAWDTEALLLQKKVPRLYRETILKKYCTGLQDQRKSFHRGEDGGSGML